MIGKILLGLTLTTAVVLKDGIIEINVQEKHEGGSHVHLYLPATVATLGVHLAPQERLREHLRREGEHLAIARTALSELEKVSDAVLVEVESAREHVRVAVHSGNFIVDVNDANDTVHISVPVRAARKVVEDLQADVPTT